MGGRHRASSLTEDEQQFLTASRTRVDRDAAARASRRRRITQVLVGAVVVMAAVAAYALVQRSAADREARETRARELAGQAELAIAEDPERAIMLALAGERDDRASRSPESVSALQAATQSMRLGRRRSTAWAPSTSRTTRTARWSPSIEDRASPVSSSSIPATATCSADVDTPYATWGLAFDPGGAELAVAYEGSSGAPAIGRFEVPSGRAAGELLGTGRAPTGSSRTTRTDAGSGRCVGRRRTEREIVVWAVDSPAAPISLGPGTAYGFLPGTTSVAIAGGDDQGSLAVVDIETGDVVRSIEIPDIEVDGGIAVDPTANRLALVSVAAGQVVVLDLDGGEPVDTLDVVGTAVGRLQPRRTMAGGRLLRQPRPPVRHRGLRRDAPGRDRRATSDVVAFAPDSSRLASISAGQLRFWELAPEGHPALGNFHTSGTVERARRRRRRVGGGGHASTSPDASVTVERIDLATGEGVEVADGLHFQPNNMGPLISADLHVAAGLDDEFRTHVIDLDTGADVELERCEVVRALDQHRAPGAHRRVDPVRGGGRSGGAAGTRCPQPRARPAHRPHGPRPRRPQDMWSGVFGPPAADGLPGLVAVLGNDDTVTVYRLPGGDLLGSYVSTDGFPLAAAFTADGSRLAVTKDTGRDARRSPARLRRPFARRARRRARGRGWRRRPGRPGRTHGRRRRPCRPAAPRWLAPAAVAAITWAGNGCSSSGCSSKCWVHSLRTTRQVLPV